VPLFRYRATDIEGAPFEGFMEAYSTRGVAKRLAERGHQVEIVNACGTRRWWVPGMRRVSSAGIARLFDELRFAALHERPLGEALDVLARDGGMSALTRLCRDLRRRIDGGSTLADAMTHHLGHFTPLHISAVAHGEKTGNLALVFAQLARYARSRDRAVSERRYLLLNPYVFIGVAVLFGAAALYVMARLMLGMGETFQQLGGRLPAPTQFALDVSSWVAAGRRMSVICALVVLVNAFVIAVHLLRKNRAVGPLVDGFRSHLPRWGRPYRARSIARFSRALGVLLGAGVPAEESLDFAARAADNAVLRRAAAALAQEVAAGNRLSRSLSATTVLPETFGPVIAPTRSRQETAQSLILLANTYEAQGTRQQSFQFPLIALLYLLIAFVFGFALISAYIPLFSVADILSGG